MDFTVIRFWDLGVQKLRIFEGSGGSSGAKLL